VLLRCLVVLLVVAVCARAALADGERRAAVVPFSGPRAARFEGTVVRLLHNHHTVVSGRSFARVAGARAVGLAIEEGELTRAARALDLDAVVLGAVARRGPGYRLTVEVRAGAGGALMGRYQVSLPGPRLVGEGRRRLGRHLRRALARLPRTAGDERRGEVVEGVPDAGLERDTADDTRNTDDDTDDDTPDDTLDDTVDDRAEGDAGEARDRAAVDARPARATDRQGAGAPRDRLAMEARRPAGEEHAARALQAERRRGGQPSVAPLAVSLECQAPGRSKACPTFLRGFLDESQLLRFAPRAAADVVLFVNATELPAADRIQLRFVSRLAGAPPAVEQLVTIESRAADDAQRARLRSAFLRGIALFVAARRPEVVDVRLATPTNMALVAATTTPWSVSLELGGSGSWTEKFRSFEGTSQLRLSRVTATSKLVFGSGASLTSTRQPPLVVDGNEASLDTDQSSAYAFVNAERHLSEHWSTGWIDQLDHEDREGQVRYRNMLLSGIQWDAFRADDPRGNRLWLYYRPGFQVEKYNRVNELGERRAAYPVHLGGIGASVRRDRVTFGLFLEGSAEMLRPTRRHRLTATPDLKVPVGDHVDFSLSLSIAKSELPGPAMIDESNYEEVIRASYAQPLSITGRLSIKLHWDRTNGAQNNRFGDD